MSTNNHVFKPFDQDKSKLESIFEKIHSGNTILLLGAGASITDKKYLSSDIIEYFSNKLGRKSNTNDIVKFVDYLSLNPEFNRKEFDDFVYNLLDKLSPNKVHETIFQIMWRMIITTNFDLLLEKTQYDLKDSSTPIFELLPIRSINESHTIPSKKQVPYYKLNGCMSDRSKYKFIFSSNDFRTANKYYKKVLNSLNSLSNDISFLSIGYSYSDPLAQIILDKFDSYNYRERKWIYSVDPSMEETDVRLDYFTQNKISIIKMTGLDFFDAYNKWESQKIKNKKIYKSITNNNNEKLPIPIKLLSNLDGVLTQLNNRYEGRIIS